MSLIVSAIDNVDTGWVFSIGDVVSNKEVHRHVEITSESNECIQVGFGFTAYPV
jgi:hypothetical protein